MIGRTLAVYFAGRFSKMVLAMFVMFFLLIATISYFEVVRRVLKYEDYNAWLGALIVMMRVPAFSEYALPFAALFGSMAAFVTANRRLEVVIVRAAGISAWQFLLPATAVGLLVGVLATTLYNPVAMQARSFSDNLNATTRAETHTAFEMGNGGPVWLRQASEDRESIIGATETFNGGLGLVGVTAMIFDRQGKFLERVDSSTAEFTPGAWELKNATITSVGKAPAKVEIYQLPTMLSPDQVKQTFENTDVISFWGLPGLISAAEAAGLPTDRYRLRYHSLLSQPILLLSMVLIAAVVSLRFSRSKDLGQMILTGIAIGFVLYVVTKIARDLGGAGIVPATLAAWLPAIVATLIGTTVLLHLEDG